MRIYFSRLSVLIMLWLNIRKCYEPCRRRISVVVIIYLKQVSFKQLKKSKIKCDPLEVNLESV